MLSVCTNVYTVVHYEYMGTGYADIEHFKGRMYLTTIEPYMLWWQRTTIE